jgi:hypothetical protein
MTRNPFGFTETAAERYLREEREHAKLFKDMLGGGAVATAIREATQVRDLMRGVDFDRPYRGVLDALERDRKEHASFKALTSTAWALSVTETARNIAERNAGLFEDQRRLSGSVLDTVKAFDLNRSTVATAIAAASSGDSVRRMIAEALPRFSGFSAIAEQMRLVDAMTLRASEGIVQSATALAAEMVLETQRIAEAIVAAPTDEESIELQGKLLELIIGFVARLGPNTITELQNMGLFQWSAWFGTMLGLLLAIAAMNSDMSQQEKAAFGELNQKVEQLQQETHRYYEAEGRAEEAYVADLPRAELARDATLRRTPERAGAVVMKAPRGMLLAVEKSERRWRLVVFRDPLSNQLARAWVYETAVTLLAPALDSPEK